ncbi:gamma carbonic anhydrase family protein [Fonticella tunisiensis]|uniref:Carbonic anhydrase/acetyltransferase-like protein (Isoleucine patch superfamily) n=1 Tax=Fonticella tunisiensis TaxID=1096341 RepID=A0A4R7K8F7_9CLOT|nr:gamma carbonic anhydrase family protein [Fonticella tunisiensis]TDT47617.1 carbonic anhydrase/acetyltransferase-like protein (isoleucine patch superfamily) [Fonticella tunisiensis]
MIRNYFEKLPKIHSEAFVADSADVIGDVEVGEGSSIWYRAVLRGDINSIRIGKNTNVQDGAVIHNDYKSPAVIGDNVTIGHNAIVHGATIKDNCLIGMGAVILNDAVIGENCIIGAGAIVTQGKVIPPESLVLGAPGRVVRSLTLEEIESIRRNADIYVNLIKGHR